MSTDTERTLLRQIADAAPKGPSYGPVDGLVLLRDTAMERAELVGLVRQLERRGFLRVYEAHGGLGGIAFVELLAPAREWLHTVRADVPSPRADADQVLLLLEGRSSMSIEDIAAVKGWALPRAVDAAASLCSRRLATRLSEPLNIGQHEIARVA